MYASSKITPSKHTSENIQMEHSENTRYQLSDRRFVELPICKAKAVVLRNNFILRSKSFILRNVPINTYDIIITPD